MADAEFFFDPVCPWAWITSRWVKEVQSQRDYEVSWKFISLRIVNEARGYGENSQYEQIHDAGLRGLRVASAARAHGGNAAVDAFYTRLGTAVHKEANREMLVGSPRDFVARVLGEAGLPVTLADALDDTTHDELIRHETEMALERTGRDVGTPIITFFPNTERAASLFGPVVPRIPRGAEALELWDAVATIAGSGVAEIKRSLRGAPQFD